MPLMNLRVREENKALWGEAAARSGVTLSEWIRAVLHDAVRPKAEGAKADKIQAEEVDLARPRCPRCKRIYPVGGVGSPGTELEFAL